MRKRLRFDVKWLPRKAPYLAIGGPRPPAVAVFFDREEHTFSLVDVAA